MTNWIRRFKAEENGAVTVDWVVLTASIFGLALAVLTSVHAGATQSSNSVGSRLSTMTVMSF